VRENARARRIRPRAGTSGQHVVELADGSSIEGEVIELNVGRTAAPALSALDLAKAGVNHDGGDWLAVDDRLRAADRVYGVGDCIDREMSTHLGHYEGETAVKVALGDDVRADFSAVPRAVYTDPKPPRLASWSIRQSRRASTPTRRPRTSRRARRVT